MLDKPQAGNRVKCDHCDLMLEREQVGIEGVQDPSIIGHTPVGESASTSVARAPKLAERQAEEKRGVAGDGTV